jgi:hypothetical protein
MKIGSLRFETQGLRGLFEIGWTARLVSLSLSILLVSSVAIAQQRISGTVTDKTSNTPLGGLLSRSKVTCSRLRASYLPTQKADLLLRV